MDSLFSVKGKTILVVGASSGIGEHAARLFAARGALVIVAARRKEKLEQLAKEFNCKSLYLDVTKPSTFAEALKPLGKIDVLLNTAGIAIRKKALEHSEEDWDRLMGINLKGTWAMSQAVIKQMVEHQTQGKIIHISSIFGHVTAQDFVLYATSKAGVEHLTRSLALESAAFGICVNAIAPGYIETDLNRDYLKKGAAIPIIDRTPLKRLGNLNDLEGALLLLASSASDYITGTILPVDGGCAVQRFI